MAAADALFYERGVASVSLEAVAAAAGVTRRTLYYHFSSKDVLVAAYLERRDRHSRALLERRAVDRPPGRKILGVFEDLERWFHTREYRGCALTNALGEGGATVVVTTPITRRHKDAIRDWFVATCEAAGAREPATVGEMLMLLFDGAQTSAATRRDPGVARHAREAATILLRAHGVDEI